jgi:hypothetical protein
MRITVTPTKPWRSVACRRPPAHYDQAVTEQDELRRLVATLQPLKAAVRQAQSIRIERRSQASSDGARLIGRYAWQIASVRLAAASDHLQIWAELATDEPIVLPFYAHYSLLRTALECSATVRWLVDAASQTDRIRRGVGAQLWDLEERGKSEAAAHRHGRRMEPKEPGKPAARRIADLRDRAKAAGIRPSEVNIVGICKDYGQTASDPPGAGEGIYRILSAAAHGAQWIALAISDHEAVGDFDRFRTQTRRLTANTARSVAFTAFVMDVYLAAGNEAVTYAAPRTNAAANR